MLYCPVPATTIECTARRLAVSSLLLAAGCTTRLNPPEFVEVIKALVSQFLGQPGTAWWGCRANRETDRQQVWALNSRQEAQTSVAVE